MAFLASNTIISWEMKAITFSLCHIGGKQALYQLFVFRDHLLENKDKSAVLRNHIFERGRIHKMISIENTKGI